MRTLELDDVGHGERLFKPVRFACRATATRATAICSPECHVSILITFNLWAPSATDGCRPARFAGCIVIVWSVPFQAICRPLMLVVRLKHLAKACTINWTNEVADLEETRVQYCICKHIRKNVEYRLKGTGVH